MEKPQVCDVEKLRTQDKPKAHSPLRGAIGKQIGRFGNHVPLPDIAGLEEIEQAFRNRCEDAAMVQKVGDRMIATLHFHPKPVDVYEAADFVLDAEAAAVVARNGRTWKDGYKCEICKDTAWISSDVNGYSVAQRCKCTPLAQDGGE